MEKIISISRKSAYWRNVGSNLMSTKLNMKIISTIFLLLLISCNSKTKEKRVQKDRLEGDSFKRVWLNIRHFDKGYEEAEIYITKNNDTLPNQHKLFKNGQIDINESEYYDLKISETNRPHIYAGEITLHTFYQNLKLDNANKRTVEFDFCQQTKDSIYLKFLESKTSNTIRFEFQNYYGKRLNGYLYQLVLRDTIINGEKQFNMRQTKLIVDNYVKTNNAFLDVDTIKKYKKFNPGKLKLYPGK